MASIYTKFIIAKSSHGFNMNADCNGLCGPEYCTEHADDDIVNPECYDDPKCDITQDVVFHSEVMRLKDEVSDVEYYLCRECFNNGIRMIDGEIS